MSMIDQLVIALGGYIVFSAILSYGISSFSSQKTEIKPPQVEEKKNQAPQPKPKREKMIKDGQQALCIPCERYFENDTYLKNHLEGAKHLKKAQGHVGELYKIVPLAAKKNK